MTMSDLYLEKRRELDCIKVGLKSQTSIENFRSIGKTCSDITSSLVASGHFRGDQTPTVTFVCLIEPHYGNLLNMSIDASLDYVEKTPLLINTDGATEVFGNLLAIGEVDPSLYPIFVKSVTFEVASDYGNSKEVPGAELLTHFPENQSIVKSGTRLVLKKLFFNAEIRKYAGEVDIYYTMTEEISGKEYNIITRIQTKDSTEAQGFVTFNRVLQAFSSKGLRLKIVKGEI